MNFPSASQPGEVLDDDRVDVSRPDFLHHPLELRPLERRTGDAVIRELVYNCETILCRILA